MENVRNLFSGKAVYGARKFNGTAKKLGVGIHKNCKFEGVEIGDNYLDIFVANDEGESQNKRIWFPDENKIYVRDGEEFEEAVERDTIDRLDHIVSLVEVLHGQEVAENLEAKTFLEFCEKTKTLCNGVIGTRVNVKLIYDKAGDYSEFPYFPPYLERYVEGQEPTLKFTKYELEKRMTPNPTLNSDNAVLPGAANDISNVL